MLDDRCYAFDANFDVFACITEFGGHRKWHFQEHSLKPLFTSGIWAIETRFFAAVFVRADIGSSACNE